MLWRTTAVFLLVACSPVAMSAADVTLERVYALALTFFRDTAEVPMDVMVTKVITDAGGKVKHRSQSTVHMVFNGYNQRTEKFSLRANAGPFSRETLRDSIAAGLPAFPALGLLKKQDADVTVNIQQPSAPDQPTLVTIKSAKCPAMDLLPQWLMAKHHCGVSEMSVMADANGDLTFQQFVFDDLGPPGTGKAGSLGDVQVLALHATATFQRGFLPGDSKPFLWPKETVTTLKTDKGTHHDYRQVYAQELGRELKSSS